jgi:hypothetical protein
VIRRSLPSADTLHHSGAIGSVTDSRAIPPWPTCIAAGSAESAAGAHRRRDAARSESRADFAGTGEPTEIAVIAITDDESGIVGPQATC